MMPEQHPSFEVLNVFHAGTRGGETRSHRTPNSLSAASTWMHDEGLESGCEPNVSHTAEKAPKDLFHDLLWPPVDGALTQAVLFLNHRLVNKHCLN